MIVDRGAVASALEKWNERRRRIFYPKTDDIAPPAGDVQVHFGLFENAAEIEPIQGGTLHRLFRVQQDGKNWILKLAFGEADFGFAIESRIMRQLRELDLPALEIEGFDVLRKGRASPYLVIEEARGRTLKSYENAETQQLPEPLLLEFGKFLARVHEIPATGAGLLDCAAEGWQGLLPNWWDYIHLRLDEHIEVCREIAAIHATEAAAIKEHFAPRIEAPIRLLHGDAGHHNVFSDEREITAMIDWEDALCGDPVFDIAYWGTFVRDEMRAQFLEGYQTVQKLPADFEHRYWLYYLRVALSKTVHRHRFGVTDRPGRPPASQRIQKALSNLAKL